jgi:hypothetical protein
MQIINHPLNTESVSHELLAVPPQAFAQGRVLRQAEQSVPQPSQVTRAH